MTKHEVEIHKSNAIRVLCHHLYITATSWEKRIKYDTQIIITKLSHSMSRRENNKMGSLPRMVPYLQSSRDTGTNNTRRMSGVTFTANDRYKTIGMAARDEVNDVGTDTHHTDRDGSEERLEQLSGKNESSGVPERGLNLQDLIALIDYIKISDNRDNERYFQLIRHENDMINARMTWWLVLQGFMLAGIAFGWEKSLGLVVIFSFIGVLTSLSSAIVLSCAIYAIGKLGEQCHERYPLCDPAIGLADNDSDKPIKIIPYLPRWLLHLMLPWHIMPFLFVFGWISVMIVRVEGV